MYLYCRLFSLNITYSFTRPALCPSVNVLPWIWSLPLYMPLLNKPPQTTDIYNHLCFYQLIHFTQIILLIIVHCTASSKIKCKYSALFNWVFFPPTTKTIVGDEMEMPNIYDIVRKCWSDRCVSLQWGTALNDLLHHIFIKICILCVFSAVFPKTRVLSLVFPVEAAADIWHQSSQTAGRVTAVCRLFII